MVTSLYALIELYNYPIFNFEMEDKDKRLFAKYAILRVLLTEIEIAPMLPRELRSYYIPVFSKWTIVRMFLMQFRLMLRNVIILLHTTGILGILRTK